MNIERVMDLVEALEAAAMKEHYATPAGIQFSCKIFAGGPCNCGATTLNNTIKNFKEEIRKEMDKE